ncbi:MAG: glycosyltransferase [Gemmatimonadales bacterium]
MAAERPRQPVVLLAYHYPPDAEVGGLRATKVAGALRAAGHEVTVIRASPTPAEPTRDESGSRIVTVVPGASPRELYARLRERVSSARTSGSTEQAAPAETWQPPRELAPWRRWLFSLFWLPDDKQGFIWRGAQAAIEELRRYGPNALLYSTSPPHSTHVAGLIAHLSTRAPWIVELRDPWTGNPGKPWYSRSAATDAIEWMVERQCLRSAALVVGVSEGICEMLVNGRAQLPPSRAVLVRNGIDRLAAPTPARGEGPLRILHAGTCYLGRDPRPFLRAFASIVKRRGLGPDDVRVELVGRCDEFAGASIRGVAAELGIGPMVEFTRWLPHQQAAERTQTADVLLLLAERQPLQVPNKVYEYLGARRRILAFADRDGETARMLTAVGGHTVTQAAADDVEQQVESAIFGNGRVPPNEAQLAAWTTERQMALLVDAIGRVGGPPR